MTKRPWWKRKAEAATPPDGWRYTPSLSSLTSTIRNLASWGFEVTFSDGVMLIMHNESGRGLEISGSWLTERLMDIYWGVRIGRDSIPPAEPTPTARRAYEEGLEVGLRSRQVAIDLLTEYINSESAKVEEARAATMRQAIAHGQIQSQDAHMVQRINMTDDVLCKLKEILEKVKS